MSCNHADNTTAAALYRSVMADTWAEVTTGVENDYGFADLDGADQETLYGIYQNLLKRKHISPEFLHRCFLANRLDELIHEQNRHAPSCYYIEFVGAEIMVGATRTLDLEPSLKALIADLRIVDDDTCQICEKRGYLNRRSFAINCAQCRDYMCRECVIVVKNTREYICRKCAKNA